MTLPPWTQVALPHDDVRDEQAVKAEYAVNIGKIERGDKQVSRNYLDPRAFFETTYLTNDLRRLLGDVMGALSGKKVDRVLQLRTPFGGGKSHSLVAMYHLARSRAEITEAGDRVSDKHQVWRFPDPGPVRVAVLPCADLTPAQPNKVKGGPTLQTLWGELAFRLGGGEGYEAVRASDEARSAPGGQVLEALVRDAKRATLVLADEVLVYVEKAMAVATGDSTLGRQTLTFLQQLTEAVAGEPSAAFVYSLQASVAEAAGDEGLLLALDKLVGRVDARRVPVQDQQVREIIRRRLFKTLGDEIVRAEVAAGYAEEYRRRAAASAETTADQARVEEEAQRLAEDIAASYPFHPGLIRLMYERWGSLPSYQRTRGALQFLGTVVHVLFKRGHSGALISPGDIPLDDPDVRSEFFKQVGERERWDSVLDADIAAERARARLVDRHIGEASPALAQARVGSSTATAVTLFSFGTRKDDLRGVLRNELIDACIRPGVEAPTVEAALGELKETLLYLHFGGGRYRMDTIPSLVKLVDEAVAAVEPDDVTRRVRETLESMLGRAATAILWPDHAGRIPDERREFLFAYLPLEWAEKSPAESEAGARALLLSKAGGDKGGKRRFRNGVGFVVPQKSHADQARRMARRVIALEALRRKAKQGHLQISEEQKDELEEKHSNAAKDLDGACRGLYAQVLLPVRGKEGADPIAFRSVDIGSLAGSSGDPHGRLLELLKKQVYPDLTGERLVEILGLAAPGGPRFVPMADALDGFFAFLEQPKMRSDAPLLTAVAEAVHARKLGYVPSARVEGDDLVVEPGVRVRFGERHMAEEFAAEDRAFLVAPALAVELQKKIEPERPPVTVVAAPPSAPTAASGGAPEPLVLVPPPAPKGEKGTRYVLLATSEGKQSWYKLAGAINELVGKAASVTVKVEVSARQPAGFDPVYLGNKVKEVLVENDIDHTAVLAKE